MDGERNRFAEFQPDLAAAPEPIKPDESDIPESVAISPPNRFADFKPELPETTGPYEAASLHAALGAAPAIGSIPAAAAGAELGALAGAPLGPIGGLVGGLGGGLIGGFGGAAAIAKAQEFALSQLPDSWRDPLEQKLRAAEIEHPTASFIGGLIPFALTMKPTGLGARAVKPGATPMESLLADPVTSRLVGGGLLGGLELAQEKARGEPADWTDVAIATGFGVVFNKPTAIGERLIGVGSKAGKEIVAGVRGRPEESPTIAELHDLGVMGKGVTEETSNGSLEMAEEAKIEAHNARSDELPDQIDVHDLARRSEPEIFARYDELQAERETYRARIRDLQTPSDEAVVDAGAARDAAQKALDDHIEASGGYTGGKEARRLRANLREAQHSYDAMEERRGAFAEGRAEETPEITKAREHLMAVDFEMRDLGREVAAAYRRAAEHTGAEMVEPAIEAEVSVAPEAVVPEGVPVAPEAPAARPLAEQRAFIAEDVKRQLVAAGRPEEEAAAAGQLIAARYVTRANIFKGALGTPQELYEREGAQIRGAGEPPAPAAPGAPPAPIPPPEPIFIGGKRVEGELAAKLRDRIIEREVPEFPLFQGTRGKIRLAEGKRPIITLMRDANASTFIHETGHDWLEQLLRDSSHEAAPDTLKDDATTVLDWIGAKSVDDVKTRHHEKFARGFEQYMREGIAPSKELAGVFAKFKNWLLEIYQTIKGLGAPINDDIRAVFDRMLSEEPSRTVIAPERQRQPSLIDIHETDAKLTEPQEAGAAAARVDEEIARHIQELPSDVRAIIKKPTEGAEAREPSGVGGGGGGTAGEAGAEHPPTPSENGVGPRPVIPRVSGAETKTGGVGIEPSGGQRGPFDGIMPRVRETLIGKPNRISSLENLITELGGEIDPETKAYLDDVLGKTEDFVEQRRGRITHGQIADWYEVSGLNPEEIPAHQIGQAFNAEQMYEQYRAIKALNERIFQHGVNGDTIAYERDRALRETLIKGFVGARAEAGRTLGIFRRILKEMKAGGEENPDFLELFQKITGRNFERSKTEADAVSKLQSPDGVAQFLRNTEERTFGRMAHEYWVCAIVSNYISQMTDVAGNFATLAARLTLEAPVAATIGALRGETEGVRLGELGAGWKAVPGAIAPAAKAALETMRTGKLVELPGQSLQANLGLTESRFGEKLSEEAKWTDVRAAGFGLFTGINDSIRAMGAVVEGAPLVKQVPTERGLIPNLEVRGAQVPLGDFLRSPLNFLKSMESFSASLAFAVEKNAIAYRRAVNEGLKGDMLDQRIAELMKLPPVDMMEEAVREARFNALAYKGGPLSGAVSNLVNKATVAGVPLGKFVVPFVNIMSIMMNEALLKRTPLGFLSGEIRADLLGKNGIIAQQKAQARMAVGTTIGLMGMGLAATGQMTGSAPDDPEERAVWFAAGFQPYSIKIGDSWYSYKRLGVFGLHLGIAADMALVAHKASEKEFSDAVGSFVHAIARNVIDQSFFRGPSELLRAVSDKGYGEHYVQNFLSGFVPFSGGLGQTARLIDPYTREARSIVDALKAKIPFASETLRPKLDLFGQPVPNRNPLGPVAIWVQKQSTDPVLHEMRRLEYYPSAPEKKIRGVKLTDEQYHKFASISGMMAKANLDRYVNSARWQTIPDHVKKKAMQEAFRASREVAIGKMFQLYPSIPTDSAALRIEQIRRKPK